MRDWLLTGWKTILGMFFVIFGEGLKVVLPDNTQVGEALVQIGAIIGGGGLLHKFVRRGK